MRNVLKNQSEVAHYWANKIQESGRAGSMFFEDGKIYSYGRHFCIAQFVKNDRGNEYILFNGYHYSNSTSKHQNYVRRAIGYSDKRVIFTSQRHASELATYAIENEKEAIKNYRSDLLASNLMKERISHFIKSKVDNIERLAIALDQNEDDFISDTRTFLFNQEENIAKSKAKYDAMMQKRNSTSPEDLDRRHKESVRKNKAQRKELGQKFKGWLKGEGNSRFSFNLRGKSYRYTGDQVSNYDFLRPVIGKNRVVTTQAVEIPNNVAVAFYDRIIKGLVNVGDEILGFTVRYIDDKVIRIGCHEFKLAYLRTFGRHLAESVSRLN